MSLENMNLENARNERIKNALRDFSEMRGSFGEFVRDAPFMVDNEHLSKAIDLLKMRSQRDLLFSFIGSSRRVYLTIDSLIESIVNLFLSEEQEQSKTILNKSLWSKARPIYSIRFPTIISSPYLESSLPYFEIEDFFFPEEDRTLKGIDKKWRNFGFDQDRNEYISCLETLDFKPSKEEFLLASKLNGEGSAEDLEWEEIFDGFESGSQIEIHKAYPLKEGLKVIILREDGTRDLWKSIKMLSGEFGWVYVCDL